MYGTTKATCREKSQAASTPVTLKNRGNKNIEFKFDGKLYRLPAGREFKSPGLPAMVVWLILGDPDLRPGMRNKPVHGTEQTWSREITRLQYKWGAWKYDPTANNGQFQPPGRTVYDMDSVWQYILDGHLYCPQFGRGTAYYGHQEKLVKPAFEAFEVVTDDEPSAIRVSREEVIGHQAITEDDDDEAPLLAVRR